MCPTTTMHFKNAFDAKIGQDATTRNCIKTYAFVFTRPKLQFLKKLLFKLLRHCQGWAAILERRKDAKIKSLLFYLLSVFLSEAQQ